MASDETYTFYGRLLPERTGISFSEQIPLRTKYGQGEISVYASQIIATVDVSDYDDEVNLYTLRNGVKDGAHSLTDVVAYSHGFSIDIEITSAIKPDGDRITFGVQINSLAEKIEDENRQAVFDTILRLFNEPGGEHLRRCMENLRLAGDSPGDTGLYCYRAIESIRKHFHKEYDIPDNDDHRTEAWEMMRDVLEVPREDIDFVKKYADEPRHGGTVEITGEERADVFSITWDIIDCFVGYIESDEGPTTGD